MKTIIFYRNTRGIGDAVMLLRAIELWAARAPEPEIVVVMDRPASAVYEHHPAVDKVLSVDKFDIGEYEDVRLFNVSHYCLDYEELMLSHHKKITKSRFHLFSEICDIEFDDIVGKIHITDKEYRHILSKYPLDMNSKQIGIVWQSAQPHRNYPHTQLLIDLFQKKRGYTPIIIDPSHTQENVLSTADLDIRETIVAISRMDLVIGPDTGPMHIAGSLGIPTLWLFGATDPEMRALYYPEADWISQVCEAGFCWYNPCPYADCMFQISPWRVIRRVKKIL